MNKKPIKKRALQNPNFSNYEIDLLDVIEVIFKYKLRIITFSIFASFLGLLFSFSIPKSYELTTTIFPAKSSVFIEYYRLNKNIELLEKSSLSEKFNDDRYIISSSEELDKDIFKISSLSIFQDIIDEFNDYEEVKIILNQQRFINETNLSELEINKKLKVINSLSKNFQILKPSENEKKATISILWHDPDDGLIIFEEIMNLVLQNSKSSLINKVNQIAAYSDFVKKNRIELLEKEISSIFNLQKMLIERRVLHLAEQAELAREIGLAKTIVSDDKNYELLSEDLIEFNYKNSLTDHLRGYEILDKERQLLLSRSDNEILLSSQDYAKLKNQINLIENNNFEDQIKNDLNLIKNDNPNRWLNYDLGFSEVNAKHKSQKYYLLISFLLGLTLSSIFTIFYSSSQRLKKSIK